MSIKSKKGFTIIEVSLVLGIAGLVFLMVFIALPSLQRSQRDTQRKQDMNRLITVIENYQVDNNGKAPTTLDADFIAKHITKNGITFKDPSGSDYEFNNITSCTVKDGCPALSASTPTYKIATYRYATCNQEKPEQPTYKQDTNSLAFVTKLEGGGYYCVDNY